MKFALTKFSCIYQINNSSIVSYSCLKGCNVHYSIMQMSKIMFESVHDFWEISVLTGVVATGVGVTETVVTVGGGIAVVVTEDCEAFELCASGREYTKPGTEPPTLPLASSHSPSAAEKLNALQPSVFLQSREQVSSFAAFISDITWSKVDPGEEINMSVSARLMNHARHKQVFK